MLFRRDVLEHCESIHIVPYTQRAGFEFYQSLSATPEAWSHYSQKHRDPSFWFANQQDIIYVGKHWTSGSRNTLAKIWFIHHWQITAQFRHPWGNVKHSVSTSLLIKRPSSALYEHSQCMHVKHQYQLHIQQWKPQP